MCVTRKTVNSVIYLFTMLNQSVKKSYSVAEKTVIRHFKKLWVGKIMYRAMMDGRIWCNKCVMENIKRKNLSRILRTNVFFFGARVRAVILTHSTKDMMTILHARMLSGQLFTPLLSTLCTFQKIFSKTDIKF